MKTFYNVSGGDLVIDWGTGAIPHGGTVEVDDDAELGTDWSTNPKDVERLATAGADGLSAAEKDAYLHSTPKKSKAADVAPVDPAPVAETPAPDAPVDTPKEG